MIDRATFVVSTWFASVIDPYCIGLRRNNGQRWIKITFFRNYDLLHTQQAGFPLEVLKEIIQAPSRLYPDGSGFDVRFTDQRGTDLKIPFTTEMRGHMRTQR